MRGIDQRDVGQRLREISGLTTHAGTYSWPASPNRSPPQPPVEQPPALGDFRLQYVKRRRAKGCRREKAPSMAAVRSRPRGDRGSTNHPIICFRSPRWCRERRIRGGQEAHRRHQQDVASTIRAVGFDNVFSRDRSRFADIGQMGSARPASGRAAPGTQTVRRFDAAMNAPMSTPSTRHKCFPRRGVPRCVIRQVQTSARC